MSPPAELEFFFFTQDEWKLKWYALKATCLLKEQSETPDDYWRLYCTVLNLLNVKSALSVICALIIRCCLQRTLWSNRKMYQWTLISDEKENNIVHERKSWTALDLKCYISWCSSFKQSEMNGWKIPNSFKLTKIEPYSYCINFLFDKCHNKN